jgi:predicted polyphosphate/ATP-dependent NAD kinase
MVNGMAYVIRRCPGPEQTAIMVVTFSRNRSRTEEDQTMKLQIKLERQKIVRGHQAGRAQVVQADQRTQRERDRGASKRAVLRRELDDR